MDFGPVTPIIGAIVGGVITFGVTYFIVQKRKRLVFWIGPAENLTASLRTNAERLKITIHDREIYQLNRFMVRVKNAGNTVIQNVSFQIMISGTPKIALSDIQTDNISLRKDVQAEWEGSGEIDPILKVGIPYLNQRESFALHVMYDGSIQKGEIYCRMEDVKVSIEELDAEGLYKRGPLPLRVIIWALGTVMSLLSLLLLAFLLVFLHGLGLMTAAGMK